MLRQILKQKSEITSCSVGSIRGLCVFRYYIKLTTKSSLNMFLKTMDSKDCKGHHWRQIWHGILYDSVVQRRWSPTGGCCSSRLGVSAEVFGTVPASLTGLFPYKKALVLMNMHETPTRGFIIREGAIYTPCCFKPATVEVKCHQRFRKLSQVTLQGSYQRPMISLHWAFKLSTLLHVTNTSFSMLDFTSRATTSYKKQKESHRPQREGPCWTRCGPLFPGPNRFSASSPPKLRLPDGTDPGGQDPPRLRHQSLLKGDVTMLLFDVLYLLPPLSCPSSAACGYTPGRAQRFLCYFETGAPAEAPRTPSGRRSLEVTLQNQRGGQSRAARQTRAGGISFYLSEGSCLSAHWCFCSGIHASFCDILLVIR